MGTAFPSSSLAITQQKLLTAPSKTTVTSSPVVKCHKTQFSMRQGSAQQRAGKDQVTCQCFKFFQNRYLPNWDHHAQNACRTMQTHSSRACQCSLRTLTPPRSSCGSDAKSQPDTPTKGQYSTSFHKMPPQCSLLLSYICLCFNGQQRNHKKPHLFIFSYNTFYYECMYLHNTLFLPMNFTLYLLSRNLKLEDHLCWWTQLLPLAGQYKWSLLEKRKRKLIFIVK